MCTLWKADNASYSQREHTKEHSDKKIDKKKDPFRHLHYNLCSKDQSGKMLIGGEVPLEPVFSEHVAEVSDSPKFSKILRIEFTHHHDNGNVLNRISMDIAPFITNLSDEI
jgi:hypothetical protein